MNRKMMVMCAAAGVALAASAKIEMGAPFTNGAVLQRGMKVPVWGRVMPEENTAPSRVTVSFAGQEKSVTADPVTGAWKVELDPLTASKEGQTLTVTQESDCWFARLFGSAADTVEIKDVLVGEVWLASGQSNMECPIWGGGSRYRDGNGGLLTQMTHLPFVRYVSVDRRASAQPVSVRATWKRFVPEDLTAGRALSAVAFYYARELYLALDVPVGIVNASRGGTNIDAWTPRCGYEECDAALKSVADYPVKDVSQWTKADARGPIGGAHQQPTVLWNGMVSSFAPMATRGFIWYQGCQNSGESHLYRAKLHALYNGWSRAFENPDMKMYLVQLAPYKHNWMGICAAQNAFVAEQANAALAVTSDVGNFDDIHPNRKEIVAKRLAVHALKRDYGLDIREDDSPVFISAEFREGKATLSFAHVQNWYVYAPDRSREPAFELAGTNGVWKAAKVVNWKIGKDKKGMVGPTEFVTGPKLVLESDEVADPVAVRYMGRNRTAGTMYNEASLPLGPFTTNDPN